MGIKDFTRRSPALRRASTGPTLHSCAKEKGGSLLDPALSSPRGQEYNILNGTNQS